MFGLFCLETLKFTVQFPCDFGSFAATDSLQSDSGDNTPTSEHTGPVCLILQGYVEHG